MSAQQSVRQSERRAIAVAVGACLLLGLAVGVAWWALAPRGHVVAQPGYLFSVDDPELAAGQDGVYTLLSAAAGLLLGLWAAVRPAHVTVGRIVAVIVGGALGALVAWQVGGLLGPDAVGTGQQAGGGPPVAAPLQVHALGLLGIWPAVTATVVFVVLLVGSLVGRDRTATAG